MPSTSRIRLREASARPVVACAYQVSSSAAKPRSTPRARRVSAGAVIDPDAVRRAMRELSQLQRLNADTGAVHAAAWASSDGKLHLIREDVGRHNALDKLLGALAGTAESASQGFVVLTSRASSEMVMKVASAGITLVAAVSAPTCLAVEIADEAGITLIGFAREDRCTVYTREARLSNGH